MRGLFFSFLFVENELGITRLISQLTRPGEASGIQERRSENSSRLVPQVKKPFSVLLPEIEFCRMTLLLKIIKTTLRPLISAGSCCRARHPVLATNSVCFEQIGPVSGLSESKPQLRKELRLGWNHTATRSSIVTVGRRERRSFKAHTVPKYSQRPPKTRCLRRKGVEQLGFANLAASLTSQGVFSRRQ